MSTWVAAEMAACQMHDVMMVPPGILADLIMVHPSCGCTFREALFNGPPHATKPDEGAQG